MKKTSSLLWFVSIVSVLVVGAILALQANRAIRNGDFAALTNTSVIDWTSVAAVENAQHADDPALFDLFLVAKNGTKTFYVTTDFLYADAAHWYQLQNGNLYILKRVGYTGVGDADWSDELWKIDENKKETKLASGKGIAYLVAPNDATVAVLHGQELTLTDLVRKTDRVLTTNQISLSGEAQTAQLLAWSSDSNELWGYVMHSAMPNLFRLNSPDWTIERYGVPELPFGSDFALNPDTGLLTYSTYPIFFDADEATAFGQSGTEVHLWQYNLFSQKRELLATARAKMFQPSWHDAKTVVYNDPDDATGVKRLTATISLDEQIPITSLYTQSASTPLWSECSGRNPAFDTALRDADAGTKNLFMLNDGLPIIITPNTSDIALDTFLAYAEKPDAYCGSDVLKPFHATAGNLFWAQETCGAEPTANSPSYPAFQRCNDAKPFVQTFRSVRQLPTGADPFTFIVPNGWSMERTFGPVNALLGAGPFRGVNASPDGQDVFSAPIVNMLWYRYNPDASLADIADARFPNNGSGTVLKRDANAIIGGKNASFVNVDGSTTPEPYYQGSFWFVRTGQNTVAEFSVSYPTKEIFDAENATVQQLLDSITFLSS